MSVRIKEWFLESWRRNKEKLLRIWDYIRKANNFFQVITPYFVFIGIILFFIGQISRNNESDNNLIMSQIQNAVGNGKIDSIRKEDLHGFGHDSILVTVDNQENLSQDIQNKFIIMDTVENKILHDMNDPLGFNSSYKITFSYVLGCEIIDLHPKLEYVFDMIEDKDSAKELVVKYGIMEHGLWSNINYIAIFKYSYSNTRYEIIGTYPVCEKLDLTEEYKEGNIKHISMYPQEVKTDFNNLNCQKLELLKCYDNEKKFNLTEYSDSTYKDFWATTKYYGNVLIIMQLDTDNMKALVNCYCPIYENDELSWNAVFSEYVDITRSECQNEVMEKLIQDFDDTIEVIEQ